MRHQHHLSIEECTNPTKPCYQHDPKNEWIIELGRTTLHSGWLIGIFVILFCLSTAWGLN